MPADVGMFAGAQHHRHGVPANKRIDARFSGQIAGIRRLLIGRDRIHVGRGDQAEEITVLALIGLGHSFQQKMRAFTAVDVSDTFKCLKPFSRLLWVKICFYRGLVHKGSKCTYLIRR